MSVPWGLWWQPVLEIGLLWAFYYGLLVFFRGTVAIHVLRGALVLLLLFVLTELLGLQVLHWLLTHLVAISVIALLIVFQPELRRGLAKIGGEHFFRLAQPKDEVIEEVIKAVTSMAHKKMGAILAIERQTRLRPYTESGILLDSAVTSELLVTVFTSPAPLHDGGVIIAQGRILAAACLFPLTQDPRVSKTLGTRHRAALGLSEETDALVIVVSEETGAISLAVRGELSRDLDRESLVQSLRELYGQRGVLAMEPFNPPPGGP
ncbi:MAG: TIGR00159 family protein [Candidatus Omnitrophica bacterium]|nr:TIGR00159 family protein [Candidatus Omnitrophota bacterium]